MIIGDSNYMTLRWAESIVCSIALSDTSDFEEGEIRSILNMHLLVEQFKEEGNYRIPKSINAIGNIGIDKQKNSYRFTQNGWIKI